jgi:hypothetical protein
MGQKTPDPLQAETEDLVTTIKHALDRLSVALPDNPTRDRAAALVQLGSIADKVSKAADRAARKAKG